MIKQTIKETEQMTNKINKLSRPFSAKVLDKQEMLVKVPTVQSENFFSVASVQEEEK